MDCERCGNEITGIEAYIAGAGYLCESCDTVDAQGFYTQFGEGHDSFAHVKGNPEMSEETLGALRAVFQAAYDAAQRGELEALDEAKDAL